MKPWAFSGTPDNPGQEHQGILTHVNGQGTILKLAGFSSEPILDGGPEPRKLVPSEMGEVIHGHTTAGRITLLGWYQTHVESGGGLTRSWVTETITGHELIVGAHCDQTISILNWTVELEKVKEWVHLGFRRLSREFDRGEAGVSTLHIGTTQSRQINVTGEHVTEITNATMVYHVPQNIGQARKDLAALEQILTIATGVRSALQNVNMESDSGQPTFEFYSEALQGAHSIYEPSAFHAPLPYEAIAGSEGIAKWMQHQHEFALPLHAMLNMQRHNVTNTVSELDFLSAWLAAEFYLGQRGKNSDKLAKFAGQFFTEQEKQTIDVKGWAEAAANARNDIVHLNEPQPEPALWLDSIEVLKMLVVRKMLALCGLNWKSYTLGFGHNQMLSQLADAVSQTSVHGAVASDGEA